MATQTKRRTATRPQATKAATTNTPQPKSKKKDIDKEIEDGFKISYANRKKGKKLADKANKVKHSVCDVFVYLVDDNALQLKVLQEQFKNTRSFKQTVAFESAESLFKYIQAHKHPKRSIILVVMDYELSNSENEDAISGLQALTELKLYDPEIEVIMLSSHDEIDIAASATRFGAVTFVKKGDEAFRKVVNNMVWAIREKEQRRKKIESKSFVKIMLILMVLIFLGIALAGVFIPSMNIFPGLHQEDKTKTELPQTPVPQAPPQAE